MKRGKCISLKHEVGSGIDSTLEIKSATPSIGFVFRNRDTELRVNFLFIGMISMVHQRNRSISNAIFNGT